MTKKMVKWVLPIIFFYSFNLAYSQPITLKQAIDAAVSNNDKIKQYSEKVEQKNKAFAESKGNFLPSVNLSGGFNHMDDNISMDLEPIRQAMIKIQAGNQVEFANVYNILQGGSGSLLSKGLLCIRTIQILLEDRFRYLLMF